MLTGIRIKDFQSIGDLELNLDAPVVLLTGPSDNGKSAILRAINTAIARGVGGSYFRVKKNGKTSSSMFVGIEARRPDGRSVVVLWDKTKKNARYTVNDRVFDNCGKTVPEEVSRELGLDSVRDLGEFLHYRSQHEKHFLLADRGPKDAYRFLSTILGADVVIQVLNEVESTRRKIADEVSFSEEKLVQEEKALSEYHSEERVAFGAALYEKARTKAEEYAAVGKRLVSATEVLGSFKALAVKDTYLDSARKILTSVETVAKSAEKAYAQVTSLRERSAALSVISEAFDKTAVLSKQSDLLSAAVSFDISALQKAMELANGFKARLEEAKAVEAGFKQLESKVLPVGIPRLEELEKEAAVISQKVDAFRAAQLALASIAEGTSSIVTLDKEAAEVSAKIQELENEKKALQTQLGCGGDIDRCPFMQGGSK